MIKIEQDELTEKVTDTLVDTTNKEVLKTFEGICKSFPMCDIAQIKVWEDLYEYRGILFTVSLIKEVRIDNNRNAEIRSIMTLMGAGDKAGHARMIMGVMDPENTSFLNDQEDQSESCLAGEQFALLWVETRMAIDYLLDDMLDSVENYIVDLTHDLGMLTDKNQGERENDEEDHSD